MDLLRAKGTAKLIIANRAARLQESEQIMALVIGPPELPGLPQYSPQEQENAEKWGYEKGSTGW